MFGICLLVRSLPRVLPAPGCLRRCCCLRDPASRLPAANGQRHFLLWPGEGKWLPRHSAACERSGHRAGA